jgi:hypothetical protein
MESGKGQDGAFCRKNGPYSQKEPGREENDGNQRHYSNAAARSQRPERKKSPSAVRAWSSVNDAIDTSVTPLSYILKEEAGRHHCWSFEPSASMT